MKKILTITVTMLMVFALANDLSAEPGQQGQGNQKRMGQGQGRQLAQNQQTPPNTQARLDNLLNRYVLAYEADDAAKLRQIKQQIKKLTQASAAPKAQPKVKSEMDKPESPEAFGPRQGRRFNAEADEARGPRFGQGGPEAADMPEHGQRMQRRMARSNVDGDQSQCPMQDGPEAFGPRQGRRFNAEADEARGPRFGQGGPEAGMRGQRFGRGQAQGKRQGRGQGRGQGKGMRKSDCDQQCSFDSECPRDNAPQGPRGQMNRSQFRKFDDAQAPFAQRFHRQFQAQRPFAQMRGGFNTPQGFGQGSPMRGGFGGQPWNQDTASRGRGMRRPQMNAPESMPMFRRNR